MFTKFGINITPLEATRSSFSSVSYNRTADARTCDARATLAPLNIPKIMYVTRFWKNMQLLLRHRIWLFRISASHIYGIEFMQAILLSVHTT